MNEQEVKTKLLSQIMKTDTCWKWLGAITGSGYASIRIGKRNPNAHKLAYELWRGKVPAGMVLDHLCRNRSCVNPDHMEVVTNGQNVLRGDGPPARNARKTHCIRGHPFDEENTYSPGPRMRMCRMCSRERYLKQKALRQGGGE